MYINALRETHIFKNNNQLISMTHFIHTFCSMLITKENTLEPLVYLIT